MQSENITKVLYPNDEVVQGKTLRLQQQFFFVSCSLQDMIRVHLLLERPLDRFHEKWAVQLNDTHPADRRRRADAPAGGRAPDGLGHGLGRDAQHLRLHQPHAAARGAGEVAGAACSASCCRATWRSSTRSTARFLDEVRARFPGDDARVARMSLIDESGERYVRMANLATVGSHHVNGVARLHSELLTQTVHARLRRAVAGEVLQRHQRRHAAPVRGGQQSARWRSSSPSRIGDGWLRDLDQLRQLEPLADDAEFQQQWRDGEARRQARPRRAHRASAPAIAVDPESLFDIQVKRLHEYKRQHLNVLHILTLYLRLKRDPQADVPARTFIFGAKAAPGYFMAKLIIKLINAVGRRGEQRPRRARPAQGGLLPRLQREERAAHLSRPPTCPSRSPPPARKPRGTGNMKFALNGALTIGTLDGANVEIREEVGAGELLPLRPRRPSRCSDLKARGLPAARRTTSRTPSCGRCWTSSRPARWPAATPSLFRPLVDNLLRHDPFLVLADYQAYVDCQEQVSALWRDPQAWTRKSILNVARMGKFSSDRSIRDYCEQVWNVKPVTVE